MKGEDLIVLRYSPNSCYTHIDNFLTIKDNPQINEYAPTKKFYDSLQVDLQKGTWRVDGFENGRIGSGTTLFNGYHLGIIGVYDRINDGHLNVLLHDSKEATRGLCYDPDEL